MPIYKNKTRYPEFVCSHEGRPPNGICMIYKSFLVSPMNLVLHMSPPAKIASLCDIWFMYRYFCITLYSSLVFALLMEHKYNRRLTPMHALQFATSYHKKWRFESVQSSVIYINNIRTFTSTKRVLNRYKCKSAKCDHVGQ